MTFRGTVKAGVVVPEKGASLPEGASVRIEVVPLSRKKPARRIMKFAGKAKGLPSDASTNLKHYLYGQPKR